MEDAKQVWSWWQSLLANFGSVFTRPGWVRFAQWVTGMVLCDEEHTITQILVSLGLESRWRAAEHFAESCPEPRRDGAWDRVGVERRMIELIEHEAPARWGGYHPVAVEMLRQVDAESEAPVLGVCDGAFAMETVVRPCIQPSPGRRRIAIVTRLRKDARLYQPLEVQPRTDGKKATGRPRKCGRRMAAPQHHERWDRRWQSGSAWVYGHRRKIRYQQVRCQRSVSGSGEQVHAFVFAVEGYDKPWFLVTTALDLSGEQVVEAFAARFRQEDGFRDHKQRLGMEECRAWTKEPVLRTFQVQMTAMTLLRLMQFRLDAAWGEGSYWLKPQWNRRKQHPSILDLRRLWWRNRAGFSKLLLKLEEIAKVPPASIPAPNPREIAA
jgi:hypothetical protein